MCVCRLAGDIRSVDSWMAVSTRVHFVRRKALYVIYIKLSLDACLNGARTRKKILHCSCIIAVVLHLCEPVTGPEDPLANLKFSWICQTAKVERSQTCRAHVASDQTVLRLILTRAKVIWQHAESLLYSLGGSSNLQLLVLAEGSTSNLHVPWVSGTPI